MDKSLIYLGVDHSGCLQRVLQWGKNLPLRIKKWRAARRDMAILQGLGDEALKDIGLSRSDLMSVETGEIFRDTSRSGRWR